MPVNDRKTRRNTWLFAGALLLAGIATLLSRTGIPELDSLMTVLNYLICTGLLLYWIQSVRARLLPSPARTWTVSAALMMLIYQLLRIFKYRFAVENVLLRYTAYAYFVPMTMIPTFFLMTCLCIRRGNRTGRWHEALLLVFPGALSLLALTNDLHGLVYARKIELAEFTVSTGTYKSGPVFYMIYGWMILSLLAGFVLLFRETGRLHGAAFRKLLAAAALWLGIILLYNLVFDGTQFARMYNSPEIHTFGMLAVFEVSISNRLIPGNMDYPGFFHALQMPALITDRDFQPVYRTGGSLDAGEDRLRTALAAPVYLTRDLKLSGREIRGGYAFWAEDETAVHRAQERLAEANELIESENSLIRAETEQREKDAWLQSRHRIYHEIAETMYPYQQRISQLLSRMEPGAQDFRDRLAYVSVLNAYVKRKTNLLLLAAEKDTFTTSDLFLALKESANYLSLAGLRTEARQPEEEAFPADSVIALYDAFEAVAEQLTGKASSLMVSWKGNALALATEAAYMPDTAGLPVPVQAREEEDILYMDLSAEKGGETA